MTDQRHALILGTVEILAGLLFLVPRTMRLGAAGLLAVFAIAVAVHAGRGDPPLALLVYAAAVFFVRTHGMPRRTAAAPA